MLGLVSQVQWRIMMILSSQLVISRVYTSRFGNVGSLGTPAEVVLKKYQVPGTVPSGKPPKSEPYWTVPCRTMQWKSANRELDEIPLGRPQMVSVFMRGVRCLRPVRPIVVPSWDLSIVLEGLMGAPFETLESAPEWILTIKVTLLLALTSLKRVGDLQALSISERCMDFVPGLVKMTLRPRPGYVPKVLSTSFRSQVVTRHSFHPPPFASVEDERLHMLCPVWALKIYVDRFSLWRERLGLLA